MATLGLLKDYVCVVLKNNTLLYLANILLKSFMIAGP